ncbi:hypothetical protein WME89_17370 [Sorangium sp. So ce321]|uniref:hypothetical protein n=1 Tax=Sorangium sp. So ce321 TaxID=3133300 RepID=UPI003F5E6B11
MEQEIHVFRMAPPPMAVDGKPMRRSLPRLSLFEWNDSPWAPGPLRELIIESLSRTIRWGGMLRGLIEPFRGFLAASGATEVIELGAGAAGPSEVLIGELLRAGTTPPRFVLTDLLPQPEAWAEAAARHPSFVAFEPSPVDATRIPPALAEGRARLMINAFHHFSPELARAILADAARGSSGIFLSEGFERNPLGFLPMVPVGVAALAANPLLTRRSRAAKAWLTWATPIAAAASVWDGLVSTLRVYSEAELREMVAPLGDAFTWEYGTYRFPLRGEGYYFYGVPARRSQA